MTMSRGRGVFGGRRGSWRKGHLNFEYELRIALVSHHGHLHTTIHLPSMIKRVKYHWKGDTGDIRWY